VRFLHKLSRLSTIVEEQENGVAAVIAVAHGLKLET